MSIGRLATAVAMRAYYIHLLLRHDLLHRYVLETPVATAARWTASAGPGRENSRPSIKSSACHDNLTKAPQVSLQKEESLFPNHGTCEISRRALEGGCLGPESLNEQPNGARISRIAKTMNSLAICFGRSTRGHLQTPVLFPMDDFATYPSFVAALKHPRPPR